MPIASRGLPRTAARCLEFIERHERAGELFVAYDLARQALEKFPHDLALRHRAVLCLASTGATRKALEELVRLKLDPPPRISLANPLGLDVATLKPRLLKDTAFAVRASARPALLTAAAAAYAAVYVEAKRAGNFKAYYPGINAATLNLLGGDENAAERLAREVLDQLAAWRGEKDFYEIASELEARLVLRDTDNAREIANALRQRIRSDAQTDYRGQASMLRQLGLIIEARQLDSDLLGVLAPPRVIHYLGHIVSGSGKPGRFPAKEEAAVRQAIKKLLAKEDVGFGYGSLAAGADILFAESLLKRKASLHVVLPFDREDFIETSVRPSGEKWVRRFEKCLQAAKKTGAVHYVTEDRYLDDDHLFGYCSQLAMGFARLRAHHLSAPLGQIVVWDGQQASCPGSTAIDVQHWRHAGLPWREIRVGNGFIPPARPRSASQSKIKRRIRAMLFSDIHGFSGLKDELLPSFIDVILACSAAVVDRNRADIVFANTWGDGLFLVFDDAGKAANCALQLQEELARIDLAAKRFPVDMGLRVGLHLGPVYAAHDPILKRENFFGAQVSRTARIEPVTPEGCVYVTETMAAVLVMHNADQFTCEYVGMTEAAKHYGRMRMFLLNRRPS